MGGKFARRWEEEGWCKNERNRKRISTFMEKGEKENKGLQALRTSHKVSYKEKVSRARECNYGDLKQRTMERYTHPRRKISRDTFSAAKIEHTTHSAFVEETLIRLCEYIRNGPFKSTGY
jgi:hypothetical protein